MIIVGRSKKNRWRLIRGTLLSFFTILFIAMSLEMGQAFLSGKNQSTLTARIEASASSVIPNNIPLRNWNVENLQINALSAISVETNNNTDRVLFTKDETKKLPIASLTKLMTALVALEYYNLDQKVTISSAAMAQEGTQGNLKWGEVLTVKDLLYTTLIESSNRSAYALSEISGAENFVTTMNKTAERLRLVNTHFADSTGLNSQSYSTAQDIAALSKYLFQTYPIFNQIINTKEYDLYLADGQFHHRLFSTNKLLGAEPEIIGGKTGWTTEAKGCFMVIAQSPQTGNYIVNVVLGSDDRFLEIKNIIDWIQTAYVWSK